MQIAARVFTFVSLGQHPGITLIFAALAGVFFSFPFAVTSFWVLAWVSMALLYALVLSAASTGIAFLYGGAFGLAAFGIGASWVEVALSRHIGVFVLPPIISTCIFIIYLASFIAIACAITRYARTRLTADWTSSLVFAAAWTAVEMLRGKLLGGFTAQSAGYLQIDGPLAGLAPLIGTYGLSWVMAFTAALAIHAMCAPRKNAAKMAAIAGLFVAATGMSSIEWTQAAGAPIHVRLLQPNVDVSEKFLPEKRAEILDMLSAQITAGRADLIVTPEGLIPHFWHELPPNFIEGLHKFAQDSKSNILLSIASIQGERGAVNNMVGLLGGDESYFPRYEKFHLMPFGEYLPVGFNWFASGAGPKALTPGAWSQAAIPIAGQRLGFMICYEEMFGAEVIRWVPEASILVNPGNLSWVAGSMATDQLLHIARMRALESGRPVLRVPNVGNTAIIDHLGKLSFSLPASVRAALEGPVQGRQGRTPYSVWGDGLVAILILLGVLMGFTSLFRWRKS